MRTCTHIIAILTLACLSACHGPILTTAEGEIAAAERKNASAPAAWAPSAFFTNHDPLVYFGSPPAGSGHETLQAIGSDDPQVGDGVAENSASIRLLCNGDLALGQEAMQAYRTKVKQELSDAGCELTALSAASEEMTINLQYQDNGTTGLFRANALPTADGDMQLDIFIYEYK